MQEYGYLRRNQIAEVYGIAEITVSKYRREMEDSGIFLPRHFWKQSKGLWISAPAFEYFMEHRKEIRAGKQVKKYIGG